MWSKELDHIKYVYGLYILMSIFVPSSTSVVEKTRLCTGNEYIYGNWLPLNDTEAPLSQNLFLDGQAPCCAANFGPRICETENLTKTHNCGCIEFSNFKNNYIWRYLNYYF